MRMNGIYGPGRPLRSVHITNYYHEFSGGVKSNYDKLLRAADRHRRYVSLIVPGDHDHFERVGEFGKIYYIKARQAPIFDKRYRMILPNQYMPGDSAVRKVLLEEMPEIVEIYDNYALTLLAGITRTGHFKELGRPMFVYFTGERFDTIFKSFVAGGRFGGWFSRRLLSNFNLPMFDYYIANSEFVASELLTAFRKRNNPHRSDWFYNKCTSFFQARTEPLEERLAICPRGVNTRQFSPSRRSAETRRRICEAAGVPAESTIAFSSTRLSPEKNVRLLPEIMSVLAEDREYDFRMLIAGAGPEEEKLREQAERFPGKIILLGHLDKSTLADHYANVDVFLHPNPREPFGNVGLEAMASGAACVVPNSGGVLTYANERNAWLVDADRESFAAAIKEAVSDDSLRRSKSENAVETAFHNSDDAAIDLLFSTYDRMYRSFTSSEDWSSTRPDVAANVELAPRHS